MNGTGILHDIIYGNIPNESFYNTLVQHDCMQYRQEKFHFKRIDMNYHFEMCRQTNGFQCRYHMSENAYRGLVNILHDDISPNVERSRASTNGNSPISSEMVTCMRLRFMGGEKSESLAVVYGVRTH